MVTACTGPSVKPDVFGKSHQGQKLKDFIPQLEALGWMEDKVRECDEVKGQNLCLKRIPNFEPYLAKLAIADDQPDEIQINILLIRVVPPETVQKLHEDLRQLLK